MKADIHPEMNVVKVHCACGNEFETLSTSAELRLEICGACHPFYTGKKRMVTARGRVEQFQKRYEGVDLKSAAKAAKPAKKRK
jgi:large subunit ribosomal protein L31